MHPFKSVLYLERRLEGPARAFSSALGLAAAHGASLTLAAVLGDSAPGVGFRPSGGSGRRCVPSARAWRRRLDELAACSGDRGVPARVLLLKGDLADAVNREVRRNGQELVVKVDESDRLLRPWRVHPWDRRLLRECPTAVWLLHPAQGAGVRAVLAAVDVAEVPGGNRDGQVLRRAASVAGRFGAELHVVHAWSLLGESFLAGPVWRSNAPPGRLQDESHRARTEALERMLDHHGIPRPTSVSVRKGDPVREIRHAAWRTEADVVVLGASSRTGWQALMGGNVPEGLLGRVSASVLAVRRRPAGAEEARTASRTSAADVTWTTGGPA